MFNVHENPINIRVNGFESLGRFLGGHLRASAHPCPLWITSVVQGGLYDAFLFYYRYILS